MKKAKRPKKRARKRNMDFRTWTLAALLKRVKEGTPYLAKCGWREVFMFAYGDKHTAEDMYQKFRYSDDRDDVGMREFLIEKYLLILQKQKRSILRRS